MNQYIATHNTMVITTRSALKYRYFKDPISNSKTAIWYKVMPLNPRCIKSK